MAKKQKIRPYRLVDGKYACNTAKTRPELAAIFRGLAKRVEEMTKFESLLSVQFTCDTSGDYYVETFWEIEDAEVV